MTSVVISGSGLWKPAETVTNEELVQAYNAYRKNITPFMRKNFKWNGG